MKEPYSTTDCVFTFQSIMDQHSLEDHYLRTQHTNILHFLAPQCSLKNKRLSLRMSMKPEADDGGSVVVFVEELRIWGEVKSRVEIQCGLRTSWGTSCEPRLGMGESEIG